MSSFSSWFQLQHNQSSKQNAVTEENKKANKPRGRPKKEKIPKPPRIPRAKIKKTESEERKQAKYTWYKAWHKRQKMEVLTHYGLRCACCGDTTIEFLSLDHIEGGGNKHRKSIGGGANLYRWIVKNNFPEGFQVLCFNCNLSKGFYGRCPHKG